VACKAPCALDKVLSGQRALTEAQLAWVRQWFWRASFSQHYGSGGPTKMGRDKELFDQLIAGSSPRFEPPLALLADTLVESKMTWSRAAIRNAFLSLLATLDPVHLVNNSHLDLVNGDISDFTSPEKHHIFPQAFLSGQGTSAIEVHALPNFCFLPAELNKRILDERPSIYFAELRRDNPRFEEAVKTHLIPTGDDSGIAADNYLQFLKARSQLILQEIERVTGLSTAPREDQRHRTIQRLENALRDLIQNALAERFGQEYWKHAVPEDVRSAEPRGRRGPEGRSHNQLAGGGQRKRGEEKSRGESTQPASENRRRCSDLGQRHKLERQKRDAALLDAGAGRSRRQIHRKVSAPNRDHCAAFGVLERARKASGIQKP
jgi:hypothetical protein